MKRIVKTIIIIPIAVIGLMFALPGCGSDSDSAQNSQVATVQRGDLTVDITAVGNLALSHKEDLAFEMAGTVEEVLVEEGDTVEEGQELAKLDTSEWEDELGALEDKVTTAERALTSAERQLISKQKALLQSELSLEKAKISLFQTIEFQWPEIATLQADLDKAEYNVEYAQERLAEAAEVDKAHWSRLVEAAQEDVMRAQEKIDILLSGTTDEIEIARTEYKLTEYSVEEAQNSVGDAELSVEDARETLRDAQEELDEANSKSPVITAPFAGFITKVNVEGGDEVLKGTIAVQLAEPDKFEADILVGEMDIFYISLGGEASVEVDALSGLSLAAEVTHISPTATIQSGVVNYTVRVELQSLEEMMQEQQAAMQERREAMQEQQEAMMQGELPEQLQQAIEEGSITQEDVEAMRERMQQMQEQGGQFGPGAQEGQVTGMALEDFQLKEGLTVTVSLIVEQATDVLLVPNDAINQRGVESYVTVVSSDGSTEDRMIQAGISDWQYTEVTDGLSEGEQVVVPEGTITTTTQAEQKGGVMMIPGMGGPR